VPTALPQDLVEQSERVLLQFERGILTRDELEAELLEAAHGLASREFERAHPGWAREEMFDGGAWTTGFVAKRQAEDEMGAAYALALAQVYDNAGGLIDWVFRSSQWRQALGPVTTRLAEAGAAGHESVAAMASTAWAAAMRGVLPREAREAVRGAPLDSETAMIDLLESDREGAAARTAELVAAAGERGCVSPAIHLLRMRRTEDRQVAAAHVASLLDPESLADRGEFGGITHMSVELLADGADNEALSWSSAIDDSLLFHTPAGRPTTDSGHDAYAAHQDDRRHRVHGLGTCVQLCNSGDARLLGALAAIDWIAGNARRAHERAAACDRGADPNGWSASGVELLAGWVLSRTLEPPDRLRAIAGLIEYGNRAHVELGLLGAQIHSEAAELSRVVGNHDEVAHHQARANWFRARPQMHLHFEPFQFDSLLGRLPAVSRF
jgi:hypothetical protein